MARIYDPLKRGARSAIRSAVRNGTLPHPNTQPCVQCGQCWQPGAARHEYHHVQGYARPNWLTVAVYCGRCHLRHEARMRDGRGRFASMATGVQTSWA
jgi:hypothetical protein